jgi:recombination protein RecT
MAQQLAQPTARAGNGQTVQERRQEMFRQFRSQLNNKGWRGNIAAMVPQEFRTAGYVDRLIESIFVACRDNDKLLECDRASLFRAAERIAKRGLTVGDNIAWLVPYKGQVQDQLGYAGAMAIVRRSGVCQRFLTQSVYANDDFQIYLGSDPRVEHRPALGDRGDVIGAYAIAWVDGDPAIEWCDRATIDFIRSQSPGKNSPAWQNWFDQMARKCPLKRLVKYLPTERSVDLGDLDDRTIEGVAAQIEPSMAAIEHQPEEAINTVDTGRRAEPDPEPAERGGEDQDERELDLGGDSNPFEE